MRICLFIPFSSYLSLLNQAENDISSQLRIIIRQEYRQEHRNGKRTSSTSGRRTGILSRIVMLTVTTTRLDDLPRMKTTATLRTRRGPSARGMRWRPHSEPPKGFTGQTTSGRNLTTRLTHG